MPAPWLVLVAPFVIPTLKAALVASASVFAKNIAEDIFKPKRVEHVIEGLRIEFLLINAKSSVDITEFDSGNLPLIAEKVFHDLSSQLLGVARPDLSEVRSCTWRAFDEIKRFHKTI